MKASSLKRLKEYDFADAKPVSAIPALKKLQAEYGKERITLRLDAAVLAAFREVAQAAGASYQALINEALKKHLLGEDLVKAVRDTIKRELRAAS